MISTFDSRKLRSPIWRLNDVENLLHSLKSPTSVLKSVNWSANWSRRSPPSQRLLQPPPTSLRHAPNALGDLPSASEKPEGLFLFLVSYSHCWTWMQGILRRRGIVWIHRILGRFRCLVHLGKSLFSRQLRAYWTSFKIDIHCHKLD